MANVLSLCELDNPYQVLIKRLSNFFGQAWLAQLVRALLSDHKVLSSIPALPKFEYLCDHFSAYANAAFHHSGVGK